MANLDSTKIWGSLNVSTDAIISGNVGIGTASPTKKLTIEGNTDGLRLQGVGGSTWYDIEREYNLGALQFKGNQAGYSLYRFFVDDSKEVFTILNSGNVGIGATGPNEKLEIYDGVKSYLKIRTTTGQIGINLLNNTADWQIYLNGTVLSFGDNTGSQDAFTIDQFTANTVTPGTSTADDHINSSDVRLKKNIRDYTPKPIPVKWREYELKKDGSTQLGVIADELLEIAPEFVVVPEDDKDMKSVRYTRLLIAKVAELEADKISMESRLEALEAIVNNLKL